VAVNGPEVVRSDTRVLQPRGSGACAPRVEPAYSIVRRLGGLECGGMTPL